MAKSRAFSLFLLPSNLAGLGNSMTEHRKIDQNFDLSSEYSSTMMALSSSSNGKPPYYTYKGLRLNRYKRILLLKYHEGPHKVLI